jgi:hypothetical protein
MKKSLPVFLCMLFSFSGTCFAAPQNLCTATGCADFDFSRDHGAVQFNCTATQGRFLFSCRNITITQGSNTLKLHPFFARGNENTPLIQCDEGGLCLKTIKKDETFSGTIRCLPKWFAVDQQFTVFYKGAEFPFEALPTPPADNPFTVIAHVTAKDIDTSFCSPPVAVDSFSTTDDLVHSWLSYTNANVNDVLEWKFYGPNSARYNCHDYILQNESGCHYWGIRIKGHRLQFMPGIWSVDVYYNGILQFTDTFTIKSPGQ